MVNTSDKNIVLIPCVSNGCYASCFIWFKFKIHILLVQYKLDLLWDWKNYHDNGFMLELFVCQIWFQSVKSCRFA